MSSWSLFQFNCNPKADRHPITHHYYTVITNIISISDKVIVIAI